MEKKIAVVGIILEENQISEQVNSLLHRYSDFIVGRMGLPYKERGVSVISIVMDADADKISAMTGELGKIKGVSVKAAISKGNLSGGK
ncbi:MAG: TM1266 family iron-only hydrogenase system putative regulator [Oscillospiraceae bacterium]|jgi:putative iron-only hydrogenase system regulator